MGQGGVACPKPEPRKRTKARAKRQKGNREAEVRVYVFARERDICRCCRKRRADSRHELRFRSLGGKVTRQNLHSRVRERNDRLSRLSSG